MVKNTMKYKSVEEVPVWQKSHRLTLVVYRVTKNFPKSELYGIVSQVRRSSSSIPANISEGFYRKGTKELLRFLYIARGSFGETVYFIRLAKDLGYLNDRDYKTLKEGYNEVGKQLNGWINSLKRKI
jgi:four helix bundle protein